jgi:hypothetical protein
MEVDVFAEIKKNETRDTCFHVKMGVWGTRGCVGDEIKVLKTRT